MRVRVPTPHPIPTQENAYHRYPFRSPSPYRYPGEHLPQLSLTLTLTLDPTPTQENIYHRGPARCFDEEHQAYEAVLAGKVLKGDVLVVRYEGPKGAPGSHARSLPASLGLGLGSGSGLGLG